MEFPARTGAHPVEPEQTSANGFEQEWLSVDQAVAYCATLGMKRTPKTVRKWAERSSGLPDGDVVSRKQDTLWGYRWQIEKASLTRKVEEELQLQGANNAEPVRTGSVDQTPPASEIPLDQDGSASPHASAPVQTGAHAAEQPNPEPATANPSKHSANPPAPVHTSSEVELVLDEVRERIADKDREIKFLRQQLADAQAEIGKRASSTDDALKTIDRVVRSFELQAEANRAAVLGAGNTPREDQPQPQPQPPPVQVVTEPVDSSHGHQDIRRV